MKTTICSTHGWASTHSPCPMCEAAKFKLLPKRKPARAVRRKGRKGDL